MERVLIERVLQKILPEIRSDLRDWIESARAGDAAGVERDLLDRLKADWERFEGAVRKVEADLDA